MRGTGTPQYRISGSVMSHPERAGRAHRLAAAAPPGALRVVSDPDPTGPPSALRTARAAWSAMAPEATHHLVVHDDMKLSSALFDRALQAVEAMPDVALSLLSFWNSRNGAAVRMAALTGARWVPALDEYVPCPALLLPRKVAAGYVRYTRDLDRIWPEDMLMYRYLRSAGIRTMITAPNLVEHEDISSLSGNDFQGLRRSACFLPIDPADPSCPGPVSRERATGGFSLVPSFTCGSARCAVRVPGRGRPRWLNMRTTDYLERVGVPESHRQPGIRSSSRHVASALLNELWTTAYAMGLAVEFESAAAEKDALKTAPDPLVVERALATLGPGGLCHLLPGEVLADITDELAALSRLGVEAARESAGAIRRPSRSGGYPTPPPSRSTRATLLGAPTALGTLLAWVPTDHGPRVSLQEPGPESGAGGGQPLGGEFHGIATAEGLWAAEVLVDPAELAMWSGAARVRPAPGAAAHVIRCAPRAGSPEKSGVPGAVGSGTVLLRVGELYGPGGVRESPIASMAWKALSNRPVRLVAKQSTVLRLTHVGEVADAVYRALADGPSGNGEVTGPATSPHELAQVIVRVIRPVPAISVLSGAPPVSDGAVPLSARPPGEGAAVAYGVHNASQWLACEASFAID